MRLHKRQPARTYHYAAVLVRMGFGGRCDVKEVKHRKDIGRKHLRNRVQIWFDGQSIGHVTRRQHRKLRRLVRELSNK